MDVAIVGGTHLTMRGERLGIVDDGALGITDGTITHVGPAHSLDQTAAECVVDAEGCAVTPGLVDAHAHTSLALLRGTAQDVPEIEWMRRALGPFATAMDDADRVAGTRLGVLEAVASGVTTLCEYASDVATLVEGVYGPLGVRVVATETVNEVATGSTGDVDDPDDPSDANDPDDPSDANDPDDPSDANDPDDPDDPYPLDTSKGDEAEERAESLLDAYADAPLVEPAYGPQALDMVHPDRLEHLHERAGERGAKLHVHVAQGEREARQVAARYGGRSTVEVLEELGVVDERLVAVHLHGATPGERRRLAAAGTAMVGCPSSIAAIDGVVAPIVEYREAGGTVGLGTDQAPGPGGHDLLRELRTAALLSKTDAGDPTAFPAWTAIRAGTVGGAAALGLDVGRLEVGSPADVAVFEPGVGAAPFVSEPFHTAVPNLVYGTPRARDVLVAGAFVVRDGSFVDADPAGAVAAAEDRARDVLSAAEGDWRDAGSHLVDAVDDGWL